MAGNTAFALYRHDGEAARLFYSSETPIDAAELGQDPHDATDFLHLWNVMDHTKEGAGNGGRPAYE